MQPKADKPKVNYSRAWAEAHVGWSAIVGLTLLWLIRRLTRMDEAPATMRLSALVWYAPATILLLQFSPMSWAAGLALVVRE